MAKLEEDAVKVKAEIVTRRGFATSEWWLSAAAMVISLLMSSGVISSGSSWDKAVGLVASALIAMGYTVQRTNAKKNGNGK